MGRLEGEVNVLLGVKTDNVGWNVDDLFADANVALLDQHTGVMDGLGQAEFEDLGLETTLQEVLNLETKNVIELHLILGEDTDAHKTTEKGITLEKTLWVLVLQGEKGTGNFTDLGDGQLDAPDFTLVAETEFADQLQLLVETGLLVATGWGDISLASDH